MMSKKQNELKNANYTTRGKMMVHLAEIGDNKNASIQETPKGIRLPRKRRYLEIMEWLESNDFNNIDNIEIDKDNVGNTDRAEKNYYCTPPSKLNPNGNDSINLKTTEKQTVCEEAQSVVNANYITENYHRSANAHLNANKIEEANTDINLTQAQVIINQQLDQENNKTITNCKTSGICINETDSEPTIFQDSSNSYVPSTAYSSGSSNASVNILLKNEKPIYFALEKDKPLSEKCCDVNLEKCGTTEHYKQSNINSVKITVPTTSAKKSSLIENISLGPDLSLPQMYNYMEEVINKKNKKMTICKYCKSNVTNFERHLERHHGEEKEVTELLNLPKSSKEGRTMRRKILALLRYEMQFEQFIESDRNDADKLPCVHCKRLIKPSYLRRHYRVCVIKPINSSNHRIQHRALSQTLLACATNSANTDAATRLKKEVFQKMRADEISLVAKKDALIRYFGENYLKKHKRKQIYVVCSNKLRECAKLLMEMCRRTDNNTLTFSDMLNTKYFDLLVASSKTISGYDEEHKKFRAPSLAMHIGTTLKQICDLCSNLILKGVFKYDNFEEKLKDIKRLKLMIESQWTCEISSLAIKDLAEKKWNKPVKLPLTEDVLKFKNFILKLADDNYDILEKDIKNKNAFRVLTETALTLTILFNRRRIGDVQYVETESYLKNFEILDQKEFVSSLTESEKVLTSDCKRVVAGGKGSRAIVILFPKNLQKYINLLLKIREKTDIVPKGNHYLFAYPGIEDAWIKADVVIRKFACASGVNNPEVISSNRLRKQIGTLMQIMNLSKEEYSQFAKFMGHTEKTHQEYYEITQNAYQTAKVSKLLTLFDKGQGLAYKGKPLSEIDIDISSDIDDNDNIQVAAISDDVQIPAISCPAEEVPSTSKVQLLGRIRWTAVQKNLVKKYFHKHIKKKIPPKKEECLALINKNQDVLHNLDWVRIKTFVYNAYRQND